MLFRCGAGASGVRGRHSGGLRGNGVRPRRAAAGARGPQRGARAPGAPTRRVRHRAAHRVLHVPLHAACTT